ncbi:MAG: GntP family permease, partial [Pseudomonadota bacterium]
MIGLLGILIALLMLIYLAFRGISVLVLGPIMALLAASFSLQPGLATYTQIFMPAMGGFAIAYFPLFLLGAVFGRFMETTGSAEAISNRVVESVGKSRAIAAVVCASAVLTYGGVSLFVVAFALYPVAANLFRAADVPKRLLPATIALGAFTFTMTALPGTPAIQNAIPMPYFGTTPFAAPGLGIIAAVIMALGGMAWLLHRQRRAHRQGERYGACEEAQAMSVERAGDAACLPGLPTAVLPIMAVIILNYVLSVSVLPALDTAYLAEARFGGTSIAEVRGIWAIVSALSVGILLLVLLNRKRLHTPAADLNTGAEASLLPIFNTASIVGFGAVIAGLPAFDALKAAVESTSDSPLVSLAISASALAGLTGSASGGMSIALE